MKTNEPTGRAIKASEKTRKDISVPGSGSAKGKISFGKTRTEPMAVDEEIEKLGRATDDHADGNAAGSTVPPHACRGHRVQDLQMLDLMIQCGADHMREPLSGRELLHEFASNKMFIKLANLSSVAHGLIRKSAVGTGQIRPCGHNARLTCRRAVAISTDLAILATPKATGRWKTFWISQDFPDR